MAKTFLTSDTHFGHDAIIEFCNRPFKDVESMNKALATKWNERIKPEDDVLFLGDFAFRSSKNIKEYMKTLNGNKVFVRGNHDRNNGLAAKIQNVVLRNGNDLMFCVHDPRHINRDIYINLVGHVHEKWQIIELKWQDTNKTNLLFNVGVDVWKFYPLELQEVIKHISAFKKLNVPPVVWDYNEWKKPFRERIKNVT